MKREIRFRAWHKAEEKMCEVNLLRPGVGAFLVGLIEEAEQIVHLDDKQYLVTPRDWTPGRFCDVAEFELMQFTGLHDKNGKEIYEGDIVNYATKKRWCKNKNCEGQHELGITNFCPKCGAKTELSDFLTTAKVVYEKAAFAYRNEVDEEHYVSWTCYANEIFIEWVEIIGNVYENPELLTPLP